MKSKFTHPQSRLSIFPLVSNVIILSLYFTIITLCNMGILYRNKSRNSAFQVVIFGSYIFTPAYSYLMKVKILHPLIIVNDPSAIQPLLYSLITFYLYFFVQYGYVYSAGIHVWNQPFKLHTKDIKWRRWRRESCSRFEYLMS